MDLSKIEGAEGIAGHGVPEAVVAPVHTNHTFPADDFVRGERRAAIHVVEIVIAA